MAPLSTVSGSLHPSFVRVVPVPILRGGYTPRGGILVKSTLAFVCVVFVLTCATRAHAGFFDWFSSPKDNETEYDLMGAVEQVAFRRTGARMTGDTAMLAMLDEREAVLMLRLRIARGRANRDLARQLGDKARARRLEAEIDVAKRELMALASRTEVRMASAGPASSRQMSQGRPRLQ